MDQRWGDDLSLHCVIKALKVRFEVEANGVFMARDGVDIDEVTVQGEQRIIAWIVNIKFAADDV